MKKHNTITIISLLLIFIFNACAKKDKNSITRSEMYYTETGYSWVKRAPFIKEQTNIKIVEINKSTRNDKLLFIDQYPDIEAIYIKGIEKFSFPENINILKNLKIIIIHSSSISYVPESFKHIPNLLYLNINDIKHISKKHLLYMMNPNIKLQ